MGVYYLAVLVVQEVCLVAVEHAYGAAVDRSGVPAGPYAFAARLDARHLDSPVIEEGVEEAHGVRAAANARNEQLREPSGQALYLLPRLCAYDRLEVPHKHGVGVRAGDRAYYVECVVYVRHPVAERLVHGVLQGLRSRGDGVDPCSEELHPEDVRELPFYVVLSHVYLALEAEHGRDRGGGHAVLARACLGYDPLLAHPLGEEYLAYGVVYLVRAGVAEVFPLQEYIGPARLFGEPFGMVQGRWPADVLAQVIGKLLLEVRVLLPSVIGLFELHYGGHECLGNIPSAVYAEVA